MRIFWNSVLVTLTASALACSSGDPVSIGKDDGAPETPAKTGEFLADYGGSWDGYLEGMTFPNGSDRVRLSLDEEGQGYIEIGDAPLLDPPTDPEEAYPPNPIGPLNPSPDLTLHDGFHYSLRNATVESRR